MQCVSPVAACHAAAFAFEMLSHWAQAFLSIEPHSPGSIPKSTIVETLSGPSLTESSDRNLTDEFEASARPVLTNINRMDGNASVTDRSQPDLVLNLDETFPPDLDARLSSIEKLLREIVKNESLKVTGADSGSLRVLVADPLSVLRKFGVSALRNALAERNESDLLGMVGIEEYESRDAVHKQLVRASAELLAWPKSLPDGKEIDRPESARLIERLEGSFSSTTAILGTPGSGKSALLATLAHRAIELGWPVLAVKGDLLSPDISSEEDLQSYLGLDALPNVLLQRLAKFQPVLLILDQLDALAGYLDLRTARLSALLNLVRKLGGTDNIHIVLSSRTFEFERDVRLKAVSAESLTLELPAWSEILVLLEAAQRSCSGLADGRPRGHADAPSSRDLSATDRARAANSRAVHPTIKQCLITFGMSGFSSAMVLVAGVFWRPRSPN